MIRRLLLALALCTVVLARAEDDPPWYLQLDNDVLFTTDRWYSSGVRIARTFPLASDHALARVLVPESTRAQRVDFGVLQEIYAPESERFVPGDRDRAPVGRLFLTVARQDYAPQLHQTIELDVGVRGPAALARQSSDAIHRIIHGPRVDWSRELGNRADVQVAWVQTRRIPEGVTFAALGLHYGAVVGNNVAFPHAGIEIRAGDSSTAISATPLLRFAATPPIEAGQRGRRVSLFAGASARAVLRNTLLEQRRGSVEEALEREDVVFRLAAGITWRPAWGVVSLAVAQDSREFATQRTPQRFGSLNLHFDFF